MAVLEHKVDALVRQGTETNETLRSLTRAVTQLAVIEERQTADRQAVDRAFSEIKSTQVDVEKLDGRLKTLETKAPMNDLSNGFIMKVVWTVLGAVIVAILGVVLIRPSQPAPVIIQQAPAAQHMKPAR